jgi:hypothetical protein
MRSDAEIRREKLRQIEETGTTQGIHPRSLARFREKGYLSGDTLTKKGRAVMLGNIGKVGRGAVDFDTANRAGRNSRDTGARAQVLAGQGGDRAAAKAEKERFAELEAEHAEKQGKEQKTLEKIIGTYAVTIAPSDGSTMNAGNISDFAEAGWTVAPAPSAPARIGSRLAGSPREHFQGEESFYNPSDPLGPLGEARAIVLRSELPLDLDTLTTIRHHGFDLTPAPMKMRKTPPKKTVKNPSPGEMIVGPHASAETRKMLAKALAWYGSKDLLTEPKLLKSYNAPEAVIEIGPFIAIEYESNKFDGKSRIYRHDITHHRKLYISADGSTIVIWPPLKITKRGIEG